ncbi:MAG: hypothetical protein ACRDZO_10385, partial [Egibacteraceae bacterium]
MQLGDALCQRRDLSALVCDLSRLGLQLRILTTDDLPEPGVGGTQPRAVSSQVRLISHARPSAIPATAVTLAAFSAHVVRSDGIR